MPRTRKRISTLSSARRRWVTASVRSSTTTSAKRYCAVNFWVAPSKETIVLRDQIETALTDGKAREASFTNVPVPLTSFVGREIELAELRKLVGHTRLLTLTGAGGCGKTRLAIQLATELANANRFKHGVWWVELAALTDPAFVPQTVASVFALHESAQVPILTTLTN